MTRAEAQPIDEQACGVRASLPTRDRGSSPGHHALRHADSNEPQRLASALTEHFASVWRLARQMGLEAGHAEEAAQEAFIVLLEKLSEVEPGKERAFLFSVVVRISRNMRRKASYAREHAISPELLETHAAEADPIPLERKQTWQIAQELLFTLSENLREVLILHELEGLTLPEIGDLLGITRNTAASRLRLAREGFKKAVMARRRRDPWFEEAL